MQFVKLFLGERENRRIESYVMIAEGNCTLLPITTSAEPVRGVRRSARTLVVSALAMLLCSLVLWG
jgi:hypothetical protein